MTYFSISAFMFVLTTL